jgi:hypothetical protein
MAYRKRKGERVGFAKGIPVRMVGIDGTWAHNCTMIDASATGARLLLSGSIAGLEVKEFFLLLSSTGLAYRRCRLIRVAGDQIGIEFITPSKKNAKNNSFQNRLADVTI